MADERLVQGLTAWLRDSDVPAPDGLMSASRVIAGVQVTPRLGRLWPPARFAPKVEPAPALGAFGPEGPPPRPVPRVQKPRIRARLRATLTPVRLLAVGSVVALSCSVAFIIASLLAGGPAPEPATAAVVVPSAQPVEPPSAEPVQVPPTDPPQPTPAPTPTESPEPAAPAWAATDRALDWHTDSVRVEAAAMSLAVGAETFAAPADMRTTGSYGPERSVLRGGWFEDGIEQRLVVEVARDADDWWVRRIRTYDGRANGGWIEFKGLGARTRTPLGESWSGDLTVASTGAERKALRKRGAATLTFEELRLSAFGPGGVLAQPSGEGSG